jgi:hypothetical protein
MEKLSDFLLETESDSSAFRFRYTKSDGRPRSAGTPALRKTRDKLAVVVVRRRAEAVGLADVA